MSGTSEGARKGAITNRQRHGADFYSKIGAKSWSNPERSHKTGFALLTPEQAAELGRQGGKKTKNDYQTTLSEEARQAFEEKIHSDASLQGAEISLIEAYTFEPEEVNPGVSE